MTKPISDQEVRKYFGDPIVVDQEMRDFQKSANVVTAMEKQLIKEYPNHWVAVYKGKVKAMSKSFTGLMEEVDKQGLSRGRVIVRYLNEGEPPMILLR